MWKTMTFAVALLALGCNDDAKDDGKNTGNNRPKNDAGRDGSSSTRDDAGTEDDGEPIIDGNGDRDASTENPNPAIDDAGSIEVKTPDGGTMVITPGKDGGALPVGMGSCCEAHDTPGCNNPTLMVCACELDNSCCTTAWKEGCALIVKNKYCQPEKRECVCDLSPKCCEEPWSYACDSVGKSKCELVPGCF
jgi:hypothetical protein